MRLRVPGLLRAHRWLGGLLLAVLTAGAPPSAESSDLSAMQRSETRYHAASGSYFQLVQDWVTKDGVNWVEARQRAAQLSYKGRPGRLATIPDADTHAWVLSTFDLASIKWGDGAVWIGLRYWCALRELVWVSRDAHGGFGPWSVPWNRDRVTCANNRQLAYMAVYYVGKEGRWKATSAGKRWPHYLVEFPPAAEQ